MATNNPGMTTAIAAPEDIAQHVVNALLSGERYVITHGDLVEAIDERSAELHLAAGLLDRPVERTSSPARRDLGFGANSRFVHIDAERYMRMAMDVQRSLSQGMASSSS
jgi:hypothetical protein